MTDPLIVVRGVHFAGTLVACGTVGFIHLVAEPAKVPSDGRPLRNRLSVLTLLALAVAILSGAAWLVLLAADILGAPLLDVCLHGGAWPVLFETRFGLVWCVRFGLAVVLALSLFRAVPKAIQLAVAALLLCLPALVGHAGATPGLSGDIHLASDMLHLLTAGAWLGSLPAFVLLLWQAQRSVDPAWRRFCSAGYAAVFDCRLPQRLRLACERAAQQLEPAQQPARSPHYRLRSVDSAESCTVCVDACHRRGEQVLPDAAVAGTHRQCAACNATALPKFFSAFACLVSLERLEPYPRPPIRMRPLSRRTSPSFTSMLRRPWPTLRLLPGVPDLSRRQFA